MTTKNNIEEYLLGRLTAQERTEFEQKLAQSPELRHELEQMQHIITAFEKRGEQPAIDALRRLPSEAALRNILDDTDKKSPPLRRYRKLYLSLATAAAVAILGWIGVQPKYTSTQLYSEYFTTERYELAPSRGGDGMPEDSIIYYAIALFEKGQAEQALEMLKTIADNDQAQLQDDAQWNMALIYLKCGDRDNAKIILNQLISSSDEYNERAEQLLNKIEKRRWF